MPTLTNERFTPHKSQVRNHCRQALACYENLKAGCRVDVKDRSAAAEHANALAAEKAEAERVAAMMTELERSASAKITSASSLTRIIQLNPYSSRIPTLTLHQASV